MTDATHACELTAPVGDRHVAPHNGADFAVAVHHVDFVSLWASCFNQTVARGLGHFPIVIGHAIVCFACLPLIEAFISEPIQIVLVSVQAVQLGKGQVTDEVAFGD